MMEMTAKSVLGLAALLAMVPGTAHAAGLECMAQSYGAEELAEIAALSTDFSFAKADAKEDKLSEIGIKAAYDCFDEHDWSENELYYATLFELGRLSEAAFRQSGRLTAQQLRLLDEALAKRDRTELWAVMERAVLSGLENPEAKASRQDEVVLGGFLLSAGLGRDESVAEGIGELMGAMALQRIARREFNALSEGD